MTLNRRETLKISAGALLAPVLAPSLAAGQSARTKLVLLGTTGGPPLQVGRAAPSNAIVAGGSLYVVDCGNGVARQIVQAGLRLNALKSIFITHQHSDHNLDYGNLFYFAWYSSLPKAVDSYGPPPLAEMTKKFFELNAFDIDIRIRDEGKPDPRAMLVPHEIGAAGIVMQDDNVKVSCVLADHPPIPVALSYRFDTADRSIVFSGDTRKTDALINLAKGADVFVCEAQYLPGTRKALDGAVKAGRFDKETADNLFKSISGNALTVEQAGEVAHAAGVKTLVLSHFVPGNGAVPDQVFVDEARKAFSGEIIAGRDLLEI
ncbi:MULTISPECIES: MBL fold metallo-hydrolase [unclassified Bradyrhizobium]|uniref:MBL fold metallo-hydrolase n=1 Tax=unclassified Bradyrhizobium TaxID=2631580 RepID=UPI001FFB5DDD|nr:MBL fold metallo-hydrolase [Bradyrhizobium sp. CW1]MCK1537597.1 MBL fold metallo-hydrolase [Bradyrhizobium sp. 176]MCK1560545.1 MBL fold metallo-hydrolase [Bradyrhizobium sp. 171]UPJ28889.1 MBL fold metallo-hydrolase [Bradyrhizobium sp. CW1]